VHTAEVIGDEPPVGITLWDSTGHVIHHDEPIGMEATVERRPRPWDRRSGIAEEHEQLRLPGSVIVRANAQPCDGKFAVDLDQADVVASSSRERLAHHSVTPQVQRLPTHHDMLARMHYRAAPLSPAPNSDIEPG
jgi:hypothetical protein